MTKEIIIKGAKTNNLKNVSLSIPKSKLIVLTGLSGSGKSSLAFDTLQKECLRQYMASMGMVTDFLNKPNVDEIKGLSPSISVDQNLTNKNPRSTVGTVTEVFTYLRVLYARLGHRPCPHCGKNVEPSFNLGSNNDEIWDNEGDNAAGSNPEGFSTYYPCPHCGQKVPELTMANFSFNKPDGACPTCTGLGTIYKANLDTLIDPERSILQDGVVVWERLHTERYAGILKLAAQHFGFTFDPDIPIKNLGKVQKDLLLYGVESPQFRIHFPGITPPPTAREGRFEGIITNLMRRYSERINDMDYREKMEKMLLQQICPVCEGTRLKESSRKVTVLGSSITEISKFSLAELHKWILDLPKAVSAEESIIIEPIIGDLKDRVRRLVDVGVGYINMERTAMTLSAGEAQRLRLASLLGSGLTNVLYVLDEPTIGLHPRDTTKLINVLKQLRDLDNTVVVIEHDTEMMKAADYIIDIGPGAGKEGGEVVAVGTPDEVAQVERSNTGQHLAGKLTVKIPAKFKKGNGKYLTIHGAKTHNLKNITVKFPLGTLIAVTGVSGSGKSSLLFDILDVEARRMYYGATELPGEHDRIEGWENIDKIITIDQTPIGRIPRSNAATYTDVFTPIRELYAKLPESKKMKLQPKDFSFNVPGGRCDRCEGAGVLTMPMHFLNDVQVTCPTCHGKRYKHEILAIKYNGANISNILDMTINEALPIFDEEKPIYSRLTLMNEVGLGYLHLGQPATTLSGGEAQRVKLAKELGRKSVGKTLYLLDEPTTGLHPVDIIRLVGLLQRLVDAGNTVIVIEHNLDVISVSDWIIDLGPEGGSQGGEIIATGTPTEVAQIEKSYTGRYLKQLFNDKLMVTR